MTHPAIELGQWVKTRRQAIGIVAREFAGLIELSPAAYAEFERGVGNWIGPVQKDLIAVTLNLGDDDRSALLSLLKKANDAPALSLEDVLSREQLEPMRLRDARNKPLSERDREAILDAVFKPLA